MSRENPFGGATRNVDKRLGNVYPVMEEIHKHLKELLFVAANAENLMPHDIELGVDNDWNLVWRKEALASDPGPFPWTVLTSLQELFPFGNGSKGQVLTQLSDTLYDFAWTNPSEFQTLTSLQEFKDSLSGYCTVKGNVLPGIAVDMECIIFHKDVIIQAVPEVTENLVYLLGKKGLEFVFITFNKKTDTFTELGLVTEADLNSAYNALDQLIFNLDSSIDQRLGGMEGDVQSHGISIGNINDLLAPLVAQEYLLLPDGTETRSNNKLLIKEGSSEIGKFVGNIPSVSSASAGEYIISGFAVGKKVSFKSVVYGNDFPKYFITVVTDGAFLIHVNVFTAVWNDTSKVYEQGVAMALDAEDCVLVHIGDL